MHFLRNLVHLVADEEDLSVRHVLKKTGIRYADLEADNALATFSQSTRIYERVAELSKLPGIGFRSPSASSFSEHGLLGAMLIMAPTVGEAFQKLSEFIDVVGGTVDYDVQIDDQHCRVITHDKDLYSPGAHILVAEENLAVWKFGSMPVIGLENHLLELHLDYPKPNHWQMYETLFPNCEILFGQKYITAVLSADVINMEIHTANPAAFSKLVEACSDRISRITPTYRNVVLDCLASVHPSEWSVGNVVDTLNTNYKTLARRLKSEGVTPHELIATQREHHAIKMMSLGQSDAQISADLGYADVSSFARGFKSWTGVSPSSYRRGMSDT